MRVLALDQSTRAIGWAFGAPGSAPSVGTFVPPKGEDKDDHAPANLAVFEWLHTLLVEREITHLAFEAPLMPRAKVKMVFNKASRRQVPVAFVETQIDTLRKLYALAGVIEMVGLMRALDVSETNIQSWRPWFLKGEPKAKGTAELKRAVMRRCEAFGWEPRNDNEGDALGIWAHKCWLLTGTVPQRGPGELFEAAE